MKNVWPDPTAVYARILWAEQQEFDDMTEEKNHERTIDLPRSFGLHRSG